MQPSKHIRLGEKQIGEGFPVFIVFEAGPTHDGIDTAKKLVEEAAKAGADAVKFQLVDPVRLVPDRKQLFSYQILEERGGEAMRTVTEPLYDILSRRTLTREQWADVKAYCDSLGIVFFSTATFKDEVEFLAELGCESIKICSGDVDYLQFIDYCARKNVSLQFDTGNATLGDVERAVDVALAAGNDKLIVHNCPSGYPARLESINLRMILTLKTMFDCPVAFSDHTPGWEMDIAAVALGANLVEKTITLDRSTPSVEHLFSIEPKEMQQFVSHIRDLEVALGHPRRIMSDEERKKASAVRRSMIVSHDLNPGDVITEECIDFARPGFGIRPEMSHLILGRRLKKEIKAGSFVGLDDID
ncbi:MAG: N-acetylneuraminate synthase family protein [Proteobacteria bacterium]|nr:N-acetylneuraminate synthase family protein [Pseudomonadota bacterium]MBU1738771.1 N-acetylneuraminate synthase family protein [Pseudomonadota bacterium]